MANGQWWQLMQDETARGAAASLNRIQGLSALLERQRAAGPAPVELWDPPYRGDIGLVIRADGTWLYQGSPIERPALVQLFAQVLRQDSDGRHFLVTPAERVDIAVEDAPFLAVEMQVDGAGADQRLVMRTNVGDIVTCGPDTPLRFVVDAGGGLKPYVRVRGRLEALMTRALTFDLVELAEADADGRLGVRSGGVMFALPTSADE